MAVAAQMKMVNGRVDERAAEKAAKALEREGLTISSFIRNSIEHIARTGEVPESGLPFKARKVDQEKLRSLIKKLEAKPMPGKQPYSGLSEDELVERLRLERYGY